MSERDKLFLQHIIDAIADIEAFTAAGCEAVDLDAVWSMIEQDLPALRDSVVRILGR